MGTDYTTLAARRAIYSKTNGESEGSVLVTPELRVQLAGDSSASHLADREDVSIRILEPGDTRSAR